MGRLAGGLRGLVTRLVVVAALTISAGKTVTLAQETEARWDELDGAVGEAYRSGACAECVALAEEALKLAQQAHASPRNMTCRVVAVGAPWRSAEISNQGRNLIMPDTGQRRFFVTVSASRASDLRRLQVHGMDLFSPTARRKKGRMTRPFVIEGLLDEAEIAKLRAAGYDVKVDAPMEARTVKPGDTLEFEQWLARMREITRQDDAIK